MRVRLISDGSYCGIRTEKIVLVEDGLTAEALAGMAEDFMQETLEPYGDYEILDDDDEDYDEDWR